MQFIFDGEFYKVTRVTGVSYNFLAISFGENANGLVDIEGLKINDEEKEFIFEKSVKEQVLLGLNEINNELATNYKVEKIQFIVSDTPSDIIYRNLIKEIVMYKETHPAIQMVLCDLNKSS